MQSSRIAAGAAGDACGSADHGAGAFSSKSNGQLKVPRGRRCGGGPVGLGFPVLVAFETPPHEIRIAHAGTSIASEITERK